MPISATRILDAGPLFTTLSLQSWPEIEQTVRHVSERIYNLDMANMRGEQELFNRLLTCFQAPGYEIHTDTTANACLDDLRGILPFRPEQAVMLAIFNLDDY